MNVFGELILWLICTGIVWGIILTSIFILTIWLICKIWREEHGKH